MLLAQLRSTGRPINHGEFTPHAARKPDRARRSGSAFGRLTEVGPRSLVRSGTGGTRCVTPRSCSPRSVIARDGNGGGATEQGVGSGTKTEKCTKVFSNGNSYRGLLFEGRMHGEGHYAWSDGAEYTGEFREGFMWGQGEKRWPNGRRYVGAWVRDMMWGDGKMTWPSGETFVGKFRKGIFHGQGTRVWPGGDWYEGEFTNGEQEGEGTFESAAEGWVYSGRWLHGRMNGEGRVVWPNQVAYCGEWKDGIREGHGRLTWVDGSYYEGQFRNNCIEGRGCKALPDNTWFEGSFHDGELTGNGTFHWADGTEFEGLWHNSAIVGPGCHRFPDDTTITGVFEDRGASGEGTKTWANGCTFTGTLLRNQIHHHGVLKWPDGRCYVGQFEDEAMCGEGTLAWTDKDGMCRYRGHFRGNLFHGDGVLDWSNRACYTGEFRSGFYDGEGTFEWPDRVNVYRGQWTKGDMSGRGVLSSGGAEPAYNGGPVVRSAVGHAFVYVGEFSQGNMEGRGSVSFPCAVLSQAANKSEIPRECYQGEFARSMFHGIGSYTWASRHMLSGRFKENRCNDVGCKVYPGGQVYYGELEDDFEHGKGVLMDGANRLIGLWQHGRPEQELFEAFVPALDLDAIDGEEWQRVFGGHRGAQILQLANMLPEKDEHSEALEGEAIVLFENGDKYVGHVKDGKKQGLGMYVYADLTAYKGQWDMDTIDGVRHPEKEKDQSEQILKFHKLNEDNLSAVEALKHFGNAGARFSP
eukprot:TRINITY_DN74536_c0_g1_i1.p1 TRINITY_DN74536_c0_g1~~TRINITY_DN74536_c0_g1_i1.p1  ORF type:complete len:748 (-),score=73.78 TRINITY_DN74536_c0_g1_i1:120-2363(-)